MIFREMALARTYSDYSSEDKNIESYIKEYGSTNNSDSVLIASIFRNVDGADERVIYFLRLFELRKFIEQSYRFEYASSQAKRISDFATTMECSRDLLPKWDNINLNDIEQYLVYLEDKIPSFMRYVTKLQNAIDSLNIFTNDVVGSIIDFNVEYGAIYNIDKSARYSNLTAELDRSRTLITSKQYVACSDLLTESETSILEIRSLLQTRGLVFRPSYSTTTPYEVLHGYYTNNNNCDVYFANKSLASDKNVDVGFFYSVRTLFFNNRKTIAITSNEMEGLFLTYNYRTERKENNILLMTKRLNTNVSINVRYYPSSGSLYIELDRAY